MRDEEGATATQVFYDASGRRGYIVSSVNWGLTGLAIILIATLLAAIVVNPTVPRLIGLTNAPALLPFRSEPQSGAPEPAFTRTTARTAPAEVARAARRYAHFVTWDENAFSSLKRHAHELDVVVGEWLGLSPQDSSLIRTSPDKEAAVRNWLAGNHADVKVLPLINNYSDKLKRWDKKLVADLLASPSRQDALVREITAYLLKYNFPGLVVDFEDIDPSVGGAYVNFVAALAKRLASFDKTLTVQVALDEQAANVPALSRAAHSVIVMLYDEHTEASAPGPLAGQGWFEQKLSLARALVPASKLIVGIGSYAYDWPEKGRAQELSVQEALELLASSQSPLNFDERSLNPRFDYRNAETGARHSVWYLDAVTAHNQVAAALQAAPAGIALWRLGTEDQGVWSSFGRGRMADARARQEISHVPPGYDVLYRGRGEVLHVVEGTQQGLRAFTHDSKSNLIVAQQILTHPRSTVVQRYGARDDKVIALTFDDGPDPRFTDRILDVLAAKEVKATFFVVGSAALVNQPILQRIYNDGHDIGNHTFTHSNTFEASMEHVRLELNATQRLIESTLGVRTRLTRPPFAKELAPQTVDAADVLRTAGALGYWTIGMGIDPKDWYQPIASRIVAKTVAGARRGDGNIVLLHDAGGSREATIAALPEIIDTLRADGFKFVAMHELLGLQRADVMPQVAADVLMASVNRVGFVAISGFNDFAHFIFYTSVLLGALRLLWIGCLAVGHKRRIAGRQDFSWAPPSVTAIVPAYNEATVIAKTLRSLLASKFKNLKIIVVDDGSSDGTADVVRKTFAREPRITVLTKPNGGKWSALNMGLAAADDEFVVLLDADTIFDADAIGQLVRHFSDPGVGAVCGHAVVGNRINLLTRFQALEYATNQNLDRRALELVNGITVVPGAIGAWRRSALLAIGGYQADTLAEDSDATVRLIRAGWRVVYEPTAVARTEAPETIRQFMKQRLRWMFGTFQVACKNSDILRRGRPAGLTYFGLPNVILFQFLFTLMAPVVDFMMIWSLLAALLVMPLEASEGAYPALHTIATYWLIFQLVEILTVALAISLDPRDKIWRLTPLLLLQKFVYRQLLYITAIRVAFSALKGTMQAWGKLHRTGNVRLAPSRFGERRQHDRWASRDLRRQNLPVQRGRQFQVQRLERFRLRQRRGDIVP